MNPQEIFCPNLDCVAKGKVGRGNIQIHSQQVIKRRSAGQLDITRRIVQGTAEQVAQLIRSSQGQGAINTAFIER